MSEEKITEETILHHPVFGLDGKYFFLNAEGKVKCRQTKSDMPSRAGIAKKGRRLMWTDEQIAFLKANEAELTCGDLARAIGATYDQTFSQLHSLSYKRWKPKQ